MDRAFTMISEADIDHSRQPIYGLIFLYRYRSDHENLQEATCPENVWFANQVSDFSCATVSLINIINNIPNVKLGPHLSSFKDFTHDFPPYLRGEAIANFEFVKGVHNSFAKKMDMLNIDLGLQNQYDDRRKPKAAPKPKPKPKADNNSKKGTMKKASTVTDADYVEKDDDAAFHFSAYVPIDGYVWKLDGLDRQPQRLSQYDVQADNWVDIVAPMIQEQMSLYSAGDIQFGLMGLVKDPLSKLQQDLAANIRAVRMVQAKLDEIEPEWEALIEGRVGGEAEADTVLDITDEMVEAAVARKDVLDAIDGGDMGEMIKLRQVLVIEQKSLRSQVVEEVHAAADDERKAREARQDYGLVIYKWLRMLAEKEGLVRELVDTYR